MRITLVLALMGLLFTAACGAPVATDDAIQVDQRDITELTQGILALGESIDPEEAERAARIAYEYSLQLRSEYGVTDPPLIHNTKVNMGLRPRGLCYQWADDIEARLRQENFQTLTLHRAIANWDETFRIEHSTTIVSKIGGNAYDGMVLDPWRNGGFLHWTRTLEDAEYRWTARQEVFDFKRERGDFAS